MKLAILASIFFPCLIIFVIAWGISKNMGFIGKAIVWILAITISLVVIGIVLGSIGLVLFAT